MLAKPSVTMQYHHHEFPDIERYLHHRDPYLLVDRIVSISATEVVSEKTVTGQEFFLKGHFPGAPIFPGAMMQELTTQSAGVLIAAMYNPMQEYNTQDPLFNEYALGVLVEVKHARHKGFARPGDKMTAKVTLHEHVGNMFDFSATISVGPDTIMRNGFRLANINSKALVGG